MKLGRNNACPCGSGKKYKLCCGRHPRAVQATARASQSEISESEIRDIDALLDSRQWDEVEYKVRALLRARPDVGIAWKILGVALVRQGKAAMPELRRAAQLLPDDAEAHINLGNTLFRFGEQQHALHSFKRALQIAPDNCEALIQAADCSSALGQSQEAVELYQHALRCNLHLLSAHNGLGNAQFELGRFDAAVECYRAALRLNSADPRIHCNLGNALRLLGQLHAALECTCRAIAIDPKLAEAHNVSGLALASLGEFERSLKSYRRALSFAPNYVDALNNLGNVLRDLGERNEAFLAYSRAIDIDPSRAESHCNLGNILFELQRMEEATASYRKALTLRPGYAAAHLCLAMALRILGHAAEAVSSCKMALKIMPNSVEALALLGELHADRGQIDDAQHLFQKAITIDPQFPFVYFNVAMHRKMTINDAAWLQGAQCLASKRLPLRHEISLRYALGKYHDDLGHYDRAFDNYRQANELTKRNGLKYDGDRLACHVDGIIERFAAANMAAQSRGNESERPVFIVGMPRSGTSLTEQILASHPAVYGAGELPFWDIAYSTYSESELSGRTEGLIPQMAMNYLAHLSGLSRNALRVIDKMPPNFMNLGLIHAVFPRAKIIHMRRHPIDTCLSIYFQYFMNTHPYANDFASLAHYYGQYLRVMNHWRKTLPETSLLEIPYESLVADQEQWSKRAVAFLGLSWDEKCLEFHRTDRIVITASKWQIRQKIHSASSGRWRNYEAYVGTLLPLIQSSDYA
jgi:tetratricopeptide (TPR) repeat protein